MGERGESGGDERVRRVEGGEDIEGGEEDSDNDSGVDGQNDKGRPNIALDLEKVSPSYSEVEPE